MTHHRWTRRARPSLRLAESGIAGKAKQEHCGQHHVRRQEWWERYEMLVGCQAAETRRVHSVIEADDDLAVEVLCQGDQI